MKTIILVLVALAALMHYSCTTPPSERSLHNSTSGGSIANGKEKSSPHLFIFDPETERFSSGPALPVPIDDHIQ